MDKGFLRLCGVLVVALRHGRALLRVKRCTELGSASLLNECVVQARDHGAGGAHLGLLHVETCVVAKGNAGVQFVCVPGMTLGMM